MTYPFWRKNIGVRLIISQNFYLRFALLFYDTNKYNNFFDYINFGVATPNISLHYYSPTQSAPDRLFGIWHLSYRNSSAWNFKSVEFLRL